MKFNYLLLNQKTAEYAEYKPSYSAVGGSGRLRHSFSVGARASAEVRREILFHMNTSMFLLHLRLKNAFHHADDFCGAFSVSVGIDCF